MNLSRVIFHSRFKGFLRETAVFVLFVMSASALAAGAQVKTSGNSGQPVASAPGSSVAGSAGKLTFDAASIRSGRKFFIKGGIILDPRVTRRRRQEACFPGKCACPLADRFRIRPTRFAAEA